jgi:hypothetical protein
MFIRTKKNALVLALSAALLAALLIGAFFATPCKEGLNYTFQKSRNTFGRDLSSANFKTKSPIQNCKDVCASMRKCVGVVIDNVNKKCYFKRSKVNDKKNKRMYGLWKKKK